MKQIVGVLPLWDDEKNSIWMLPGYLDGVREAGGLPIIFPLTDDERELDQLVNMCDGFLFTGGQDVSPELYQEIPLAGLVETCRQRDVMEGIILEKAIKADKPILGICRGIQFINAALGGTLYPDIPSQHPSEICHRQKAPYDIPSHDVTIIRDSPLYDCLGTDRLPVNSCHHQAVRELARGLKPMAISPDGLVEAAFMEGRTFLWAVQWHPEMNLRTDPSNRMIFEAFIKAMK
jgi:putative glutamine amidotransferase